MKHCRSLAALAACVLGASLQAQETSEARLKIRRIVLYKHGVGYFERQGKVNGNASVPLSFKTEQMKDVLKSLFAVDLSGGRVATILYDGKDPVTKQLEEILFNVPDQSALTQFLRQLKGARVRVDLGAASRTGTVLGIEPVQKQVDHQTILTHKLVLFSDAGALEPVELLDASAVTILDENVRRDLARMMDIFAKARYADRKTVHLRAEGTGEREVRAGYIIETPIWKTTYRLLLDEGADPLLQGWAIVENRTDEDWENAELSMVAGSPLSFVMDLYTSYYPRRPVLKMAAGAAEAPAEAWAEERKALKDAAPPAPRAAAPERRRAEKAKEAETAAGAVPEPSLAELTMASFEPMAQGVNVGELFAYAARGPVSIKQGQAALVPILLEKLPKGGRALYYRRDRSPSAFHAFYLDNTTSLTLEKGPLTVFAGSTCLGEGLLTETLKTGMHEIVTFAVENAVQVEPQIEMQAQPVTKAVLANGILTLHETQVQQTLYRLRNKTGKAHTLWLDHAKQGGAFTLVEPAKPEEELPALYRFKIDLAASAEVAFKVKEQQPVRNTISILSQSTDQVRFYLRQGYLSDAARRVLEQVAATMEEITACERRLEANNQEIARLNQDQARVRQDMQVLRDNTAENATRQKLLEKLNRNNDRLEALQQGVGEETGKRDALRAKLARDLNAFRE